MGRKTKRWISKDKAVTFHLVHRSQQDPLVTDENAPQLVMVPDSSSSKRKSSKQIENEHKYGIYFDDDYDYLQHLRGGDEMEVHWEETNKTPRSQKNKHSIQLPSSVFASEVEEDVGLLNKAAPESLRLDLDPDVVAAMDDDFDFDDPDNQLDDDFIAIANESGLEEYDSEGFDTISEGDEDEEIDSNSVVDSDEEVDRVVDLRLNFAEVETKSRFTDYSLSSSVMRRTEQLSLLDDRFEKMFEGYDKGEIGALDCEEIEGDLLTTDQRLLDLADEHEKSKLKEHIESENLKDKIIELVDNCDHSEPDDDDESVDVDKEDKWDCESILSTYSNIYNHPVKILEPKGPKKIRVNKIGVAVEELDGRGGPKLTVRNLAALDGDSASPGPRSIISMVSELSIRPKGESPEERRIRKANLREYRHERRMERKANTLAFKEEKKRQEKVMLNLRHNLQGAKIL